MHELLLATFRVALDAANPLVLIPKHLPSPPKGRTLVVGGGKAAAAMAKTLAENWPAEVPLSGLVVTRYQHGLPTRRIEVIEASHPLPDGRGAEAAQRMLDEVQQLAPDDLLIVLLSGGGSSLLALPVEDVTLEELRSVTKSLLASGAPIQDINMVRKHLTRLSGGRLAALSPAPVIALIISDVVGDDPTSIASGPCAADPSTYADALAVLAKYAITPPVSVDAHLKRGIRGEIPDTPKPGDVIFSKVENLIIGSARLSLAAAETLMRSRGINVMNLGEIEGESRHVAQAHAKLIRELLQTIPRPFALLSGGETTVTVTNPSGRGGRNTEYLLALGAALRSVDNVWALACDTDGIDGSESNAGALWTPDTWTRARALGLDAEKMLEANNAYDFFYALNDLIVSGPTKTNVNDFRLILAA
jgi:hydroxypyruvate reductase